MRSRRINSAASGVWGIVPSKQKRCVCRNTCIACEAISPNNLILKYEVKHVYPKDKARSILHAYYYDKFVFNSKMKLSVLNDTQQIFENSVN